MKYFNLETISALVKQNNKKILKEYQDYIGSKIKPQEFTDIISLLNKLNYLPSMVDGFYFNFKIPQISKEFDLLRFSKESILNIELKSGNKTESEIKKQLERNEYYLNSFSNNNDVKRKVELFTYESSSNTLFRLVKDSSNKSKLIKNDWSALIKNLAMDFEEVDIYNLCSTKSYLISPFNDSEKFREGKYFLTDLQKKIKKEIMDNFSTNFSIEGSAGTGKTLLIYDIAKSYIRSKKNVLIVQCSNLNAGQKELALYGYSIVPIKDIVKDKVTLSNFNVIIIDEAQRIQKPKSILSKLFEFSGQLIFSGDRKQWLNDKENSDEVADFLNQHNVKSKTLTEKIRNNEEIACFIKHLFKYKKTDQFPKGLRFHNIDVEYFENALQARNYAEAIKKNNWTILNLTPSRYPTKDEIYRTFEDISDYTAHQVMGQEFDKVATFIGPNFCYNEQTGKLISSKKIYYPAVQTLLENVTRAKNKLCLIIFDNVEVFERCLKIINKPKSQFEDLQDRNSNILCKLEKLLNKMLKDPECKFSESEAIKQDLLELKSINDKNS